MNWEDAGQACCRELAFNLLGFAKVEMITLSLCENVAVRSL